MNPTQQPTPENQTAFFEDERIWENTPFQATIAEASKTPKKKSKTGILLAVLGIFTVSLLILSTLVQPRGPMISPPSAMVPQLISTPSASPGAPENNLQRSIQNLNTEILGADPFAAELSFPPVNFELSLEETARR